MLAEQNLATGDTRPTHGLPLLSVSSLLWLIPSHHFRLASGLFLLTHKESFPDPAAFFQSSCHIVQSLSVYLSTSPPWTVSSLRTNALLNPLFPRCLAHSKKPLSNVLTKVVSKALQVFKFQSLGFGANLKRPLLNSLSPSTVPLKGKEPASAWYPPGVGSSLP